MEWTWNRRGNGCRSEDDRWVITVLHAGAYELWDQKTRAVIGVYGTMAEARRMAENLSAVSAVERG